MTNAINKISDIIKVMQSGIEFYDKAIKEIDDPHLLSVFRNMRNQKDMAIGRLQAFVVREDGEFEEGSNFLVDLRKGYTNIIATVSMDKEHTFVNNLEEVEDKVLDVLDEALETDQPVDALVALREIRAKAQMLHDEMKALQDATA